MSKARRGIPMKEEGRAPSADPSPVYREEGRQDDRFAPRTPYRGATLQGYPGGFTCAIIWPECPLVLDGMNTSQENAMRLIDWFLDTGGDQARLPAPYTRLATKAEVGRPMPEPKPANDAQPARRSLFG